MDSISGSSVHSASTTYYRELIITQKRARAKWGLRGREPKNCNGPSRTGSPVGGSYASSKKCHFDVKHNILLIFNALSLVY